MLVVDASALYDSLTGFRNAVAIRRRLDADPRLVAPHVIDVEVLGIIRRDALRGLLDPIAATRVVDALHDWPGERYAHRPLLRRAWELRANVRGWDAMYVALAERLEAVLITTDERLARAPGLRCRIEVPSGAGR